MREGAFVSLAGKCRILALVFFIIVLAGCQQAPTGPQPLTDADKDQITEFMEDHVKAVLANDASAYTALFSEDGIELPPNAEMRRGKAELEWQVSPNGEKFWAELAKQVGGPEKAREMIGKVNEATAHSKVEIVRLYVSE